MFRNLKREQLVAANGLYWRYSFDAFLDSMERLGIRTIEVHGNASHFPIEYLSDAGIAEMQKKIKDRGLKVHVLAHDSSYSYPNIASESESLRQRTIDIYRRMLDAAHIFGASYIQLLPGRGSYEKQDESAFYRSADSLEKICSYAKQYGLGVIFENTSPHNTNVANHMTEVIKMLRYTGLENLYGMLDFCSVAKAGEDLAECYEMLGERMAYVHMCDGTPMGHLVPGEGTLPFDENMQVLDDRAYAGYLSFEVYTDAYSRDPERYIRMSMEHVLRQMG